MRSIPETNNFYCFLKLASLGEIHDVLVGNGWTARKSALDAYEFKDGLNELEMYEAEDGLLLNGRLALELNKYNVIIELLRKSKVNFSAELYDDNKNVIAANKY